MLTAYDYPMARLLDELNMPMILVGDSLGMVVLGHPDTTHVSMADMEHHIRAVARASPRSLIVADLPFGTYETKQSACENSRRLCEAGADAVKAEGARDIAPQIEAILNSGIPFMGHIGMLPQHIHKEGRYRIKGKSQAERAFLLDESKLLERLGAFAIVLELVDFAVAKSITNSTSLLTLGIGSGLDCDGQILVVNDLLGTFPWFVPNFVKRKMNGAEQIKKAIADWQTEIRSGKSSHKNMKLSSQKSNDSLTHIDDSGQVKMVDVSEKPQSIRVAKAIGKIFLTSKTIDLIESNSISKGNVLTTARIAGIMSAKRTADLIPLCHPLSITNCQVLFDIPASRDRIEIVVSARITAQTGVEMEALTAVSVAALTIYDMCKAHDKTMRIGEIKLLSKEKSAI